MRLAAGLVAAALLAFAPAEGRETRSATPGAIPPPARIADLAWLAGRWEGEGLTGKAVETYSPPLGGQMTGHFIQARGDGIWFFEILSIAETNGSLEYRLKHFNADLTGWEEKAEVRRFPLVAMEPGRWFFDGLTIRRDGPDGMVGAVLVKHKDGREEEAVFRYRRAK